jgi:hypothetical protein
LTNQPGYNERLFAKGIRSQIHFARFAWLRRMAGNFTQSQSLRVVELGCFDGRSIDWLPFEPALYDGFDANWEGGLDIGKNRFAAKPNIRFHICSRPEEMSIDEGGYDLGISLETMEHIPPEMVDAYLEILSKSVKTAFLISVPNEIGIPFLIKYLAKKIFYRDSMDETYSMGEVWAEIVGNTRKVHRNEHKGFDYRTFIEQLHKFFIVQTVMGMPFSWLPAGLSFTIGIIGIPRQD